MKIRKIPTENPQTDLWQLIGQFGYPANIRKYLELNDICESSSELEEHISGCISHAEAYFSAVDKASLDISPLLLYYGVSNLLVGSASLLTGEIKVLRHHGLKLELAEPPDVRIASAKVKPFYPNEGALQYFCNVFSNGCPITSGGLWSLEEILGSIPDLMTDFRNCYDGAELYVIPVKLEQKEIEYNDDKKSKKIITYENLFRSEINDFDQLTRKLETVVGFSDSYLSPQRTADGLSSISLFRKIKSTEIGFYTIYGEKFLELPHAKNGRPLSPNQLIILFMGLFALGNLSRYHPQIWNRFVRADITGERLLIGKFISIAKRYVPNLVLNLIRKERIEFYHPTYSAIGMEKI